MATLGDVFRRYGPSYLERFASAVPAVHRKVMQAIEHCRDGSFGHAVYHCDSCGRCHQVARSCGNRHCPTCQQHKAERWLERQLNRLLPCEYFLVTFTVRPELRRLMRSNPALAYALLFQAAVAALGDLAADPRHLGAVRLGLLAVLHTWGRSLEYHPHIHIVVPAGGLAADGTWRATRPGFFLPVRALSVLFRAKLRDLFDQAGLAGAIDTAVWKRPWVVHVQPAGDGRHALEYLARYLFRVAISNSRIVSCDNGRVIFRYKKSGTRCWSTMSLDAHEFIRRFLQHVVPRGFQRVRHYGFSSPCSKQTIGEVRRRVVATKRRSVRQNLCVPRPHCARVHCNGVFEQTKRPRTHRNERPTNVPGFGLQVQRRADLPRRPGGAPVNTRPQSKALKATRIPSDHRAS